MTNPTLERAARALAACEKSDYDFGEMADHYTAMARAVLMAVLPDDDGSISDIVVCDYIRGILAEGE